jgi:hypothetical protein
MRVFYFFLSTLGVWRITHLLHAEDGPWDLVFHLRRLVGAGFWGKLLDCFYCLSLWVAAPFANFVAETRLERILWWPALSGAAILLERISTFHDPEAQALYREDEHKPDETLDPSETLDKENRDVLLRQQENHIPESVEFISTNSLRAPRSGR